jgi:NADPH:quinone reductase-like Zn-dependent oxidoreductase
MNARIVRFHQTGGPEVLKIETVDIPSPARNEVRISVKALGLNRAEAMFRSGHYFEQPRFPSRLGYEAAGTVESVGAGVEGFAVGDAVSTIPAFSQNHHGVYGELAVVPATAVAKHPGSLSWEQAAAVWMQYLTAYGALISIADIKAGETVLIPAASSSVGIAASQIVNMVGAIPIALTRTGKKRQSLMDLGFRHVIATDEQNIAVEVHKLTQNKGARVVFDPVGGPTVARLTAAMAHGGILFQYGALSSDPTPLPLMDVLAKSLTIRGYVLFEFTGNATKLKGGKEFVVNGLSSGKLAPVISRTFPLDQIVEAHRYLESNEQIGKIVVTV